MKMRFSKGWTALMLAAVMVISLAVSLAESAYTAPEYPWDFVKKLPKKAAKYLEEVEHHGTVERLTYTTHSYALEAVAAGTVRLTGVDYNSIMEDATELLTDSSAYAKMARAVNPYGDGHACERIADAILVHAGLSDKIPAPFDPYHELS